jgi:glycosyltransferase involved in cell wall biosynthesis
MFAATVRHMIDVILPCLNEAAALPWVLERMPAGFRPIVADNGSTDGSAQLAARRGAADLVLGRRLTREWGAWPVHARIANKVLAAEVRHRTGARLRDLGPMRAARREQLLALGLADRRFGYPLEQVMKAAAAGWRIQEVGVPYHPRSGRSKVTGTVGGTLRTVRDMRRVFAS